MTTDNTQELDDLLQKFAMSEQQIGDELAVGAIQEETFDTRDTLARDQAKQAILDWHNKQIEEVLDRLKSRSVNAQTYQQADGTQYGSTHSFQAIPLSAIEAERAILRSNNGK